MSSQWIQDHNFSSSDRADLCFFGWAPERCDLQLGAHTRKIKDLSAHWCDTAGARELNCERRRRQKHRTTCASSGPLLLRWEGRCNCPKWLRFLFLYMVFFCFVLCFGTKCVEVKLNTWNAFTIQFPHTHSMKMSFSSSFFFLVLFWGMWDLSSPTRDETHALCNGSVKSEPLGHQGSPGHPFFAGGIIRERVCSPPETHVFCN